MQISNNVKMPLWQRGALWVALLLLVGCQTELVNPFNASYVRVMDLRNFPADNYRYDVVPTPFTQSAFRLDGSYYGNPDFDKITPQQTLEVHGDFLLGRVALNYFLGSRGITVVPFTFTGLLDYYTSASNTNGYVLFQPYLQGAELGGKDGRTKNSGRNVCYPNLSHRVPLAPIINGIDYYKWAKLPAGSHTIGFAKAETIFGLDFRRQVGIATSKFSNEPFLADEPYYLQPNGMYSLLLVSESVNDPDRVRLLRIQEDAQFVPEPTKAYIRFINAIPLTNTGEDNTTESLDFYMRQLDNGELSQLTADTISFDPRFLKSTLPEKLVVSDLKRFGQNGFVPYVELDFAEYLSKGDTTANGVKKTGVPSFIFYAYRHGESGATGGLPLGKYQYILSNIKELGATQVGYISPLNIAVLAQTAEGFAPTINTIVLGTQELGPTGANFNMGYSLERASVRQAYLNSTNRGQ